MGRQVAPPGGISGLPYNGCMKKWKDTMRSKIFSYETIIKAHKGEPEAVNAVLSNYSVYIRHFSKIDDQVNKEVEEYNTQRLIESLFKFRLDR